MSTLIQNTNNLQTVLEKVSALPDSPQSSSEIKLQEKTVTPTTSTFVVVPDTDYDGLGSVTVNGVPSSSSSGGTKQTKTGSFQTSSSGTATVDCGFKPDVVVIYAPEANEDGYEYHTSCCLDVLGGSIEIMELNKKLLYFNIWETSNGFEISSAQTYDFSWNWAQYSRKTLQYEAIKYA